MSSVDVSAVPSGSTNKANLLAFIAQIQGIATDAGVEMRCLGIHDGLFCFTGAAVNQSNKDDSDDDTDEDNEDDDEDNEDDDEGRGENHLEMSKTGTPCEGRPALLHEICFLAYMLALNMTKRTPLVNRPAAVQRFLELVREMVTKSSMFTLRDVHRDGYRLKLKSRPLVLEDDGLLPPGASKEAQLLSVSMALISTLVEGAFERVGKKQHPGLRSPLLRARLHLAGELYRSLCDQFGCRGIEDYSSEHLWSNDLRNREYHAWGTRVSFPCEMEVLTLTREPATYLTQAVCCYPPSFASSTTVASEAIAPAKPQQTQEKQEEPAVGQSLFAAGKAAKRPFATPRPTPYPAPHALE